MQEENILSKMWLESGSSFVNSYSLFLVTSVYTLIHTYIFVLKKQTSNLDIEYPKIERYLVYLKMYHLMTLEIYIWTILEAYQYLLVSACMSFITLKEYQKTELLPSFLAFEILLLCITLLSFTVWFLVLESKQK